MSTTKIKQLLDSADKAEAGVADLLKKSNVNRWEASRLIHEALSSKSFTQVKLAEEIGRSSALCSFYRRVWEKFGEESSTKDFQEAYRWIQDNPEKPRPPKPTETVTISEDEADAKAEAEAEAKRIPLGMGITARAMAASSSRAKAHSPTKGEPCFLPSAPPSSTSSTTAPSPWSGHSLTVSASRR